MSLSSTPDISERRAIWRPALPPAFHYPRYRRYWFGMLAAVGGFQVLQFSQFWLVHTLNDSPIFLGYVGLANAIPAISLNLVGGVFADRLDQRRLIMTTESITAGLVILLATLVATGAVEVWHVLAIAVVAGGINAFNQPARQALYPRLIERRAMMSAVALNSSIWQGTRVVAPAFAGALIWLAGIAAAFYVAAAGVLVFAIVVASLEVQRMEAPPGKKAFADLVEGLSYIRGNSIFGFLIAMTFFNSFFGMAYVTMMPVFADDILGVGSSGQGLMMSVGGVGALIATIYLASKGNFKSRGLLLVGGAVMTGLAIAAFALSTKYVGSMPLATGLLFVFGISTSTYMISIQSSLQMLVPDRLRGRVMGFYGMTWNIMPLGGLYAGVIAGLIGVPWAVAVGGLLVSGFAIGPALLNGKVRNIGSTLAQIAEGPAPRPARAG